MSPQATTTESQYRIHCRMQQEAAALERLCQVVRIRGFRIQQMAVTTLDNQLAIALTLEGSRPVALLQAPPAKPTTVPGTRTGQPASTDQVAPGHIPIAFSDGTGFFAGGQFLGPAIAGWLIEATGGFRLAVAFTCLALLVGLYLAQKIRRFPAGLAVD